MPDYTEYQRRLMFGAYEFADGNYYVSGDYRPIKVCASGELVICSGVHVVADVEVIASSGLNVLVQSGVGVQVQSGLHVWVSGQHVFVESGVHVMVSGQYVITGASGSPSETIISDLSGHIAKVSLRHEAVVVEDFIVNEIHQGNYYRVCWITSGLAAGASDTYSSAPMSHVSPSESLSRLSISKDQVPVPKSTPTSIASDVDSK